MGKFGTPTEYRENPGPVYFLDDVTETRGIVFQPDVYAMAELLTEITGRDRITDIGCGQGDKLAAIQDRHPKWFLYGVDYGANIERCRERFPEWGAWIDLDLETQCGERGHGGIEWGPDSVLVCSDVVEHLVDPIPLLHSIARSGALAVFSTPERDVQNGYDHAGPPPNLCHVREWNGVEFRQLLTDAGLRVRWFGLTRGSDVGEAMATQIVVCAP